MATQGNSKRTATKTAQKTNEKNIKNVVEKKTPIQLSDDVYVTLRNNVCGKLYYFNSRTGDSYEWGQYGEIQDVRIADLREMKTSQRNFYIKNKFTIVDVPELDDVTPEDVIKYLALEQYFKGDLAPNLDDVIHRWTIDDILTRVPNMSRGSKETLIILCNTYIEDGTLDSRKKISAFETALECELTR